MNFEIALLIALAMLFSNAFFVGAEFGLISARRSSIELQASRGSRAAKVTLEAMEQVSFMLAGAQLGITVCSLLLGAVGEPLLAHLLEQPFHHLGMPEGLLHPVSFLLAMIIMVYFHVVIGEMVPKNIALANPDRVALLLTPPLVVIVRILRPIVIALNATANVCLRLIGIQPQGEIASTFTRDEVAGFVEESRREGLLSENEEYLLSGALRFDQHTVRSVLLPLDELVTASVGVTPAQIEKLAAETGYSRFPVRGEHDTLVGYVHLKDVLELDDKEHARPLPVKDLRPLGTVAPDAPLRKVLTVMQQSGAHLTQVVNQHGRILGIVTLEDMLEKLVGEIRDDSQRKVS